MQIDSDSTLAKFFVEIIVGLIVLLLGALKLLGKRAQADAAQSELTEHHIQRSDLLELQLKIQATLESKFAELHKELHVELVRVHVRVDDIAKVATSTAASVRECQRNNRKAGG